MALPPWHIVPLLFIAIPGLLHLLGGRRPFLCGLAFGFAYHLLGLYWVTKAVLVQAAEFWWAVPIAVPLLALVLALFVAVPCKLATRVPPGWRRLLTLAGFWILGDLARQFALTGFPWNPLGSVAAFPGALGLALMQPAAWVTVHGLTLFTLVATGAPALGRRGIVAAVLLALAWAGAGAVRLAALPPPPDRPVTAVLVQPNVSETEHRDHWRDPGWAEGVFDRALAQTRSGIVTAAAGAKLLVWPETASPFWLAQDAGARRAIAEAAGGAPALIGAPRQGAAGAVHNSLIALAPDGAVTGFYDKAHLVPYGEYFPSYLPVRLGEQGWTPGPGLVTLHLPDLPAIGPLICFEAAFPAQVARRDDRPGLLVNLTNDSWFGNSAGPRQHLAAARFRTIEEGLPMLRAANTGISAVIDSEGRVRSRLDIDKAGVLVAAVPAPLEPTLAGKLGLWAPLLLAMAALSAALSPSFYRGAHRKSRTASQKRYISQKKIGFLDNLRLRR